MRDPAGSDVGPADLKRIFGLTRFLLCGKSIAAGPVYRDVMTQQWAAVLTHSVVLHPKCYTDRGEHVMQCLWQAPRKAQASDFVIQPAPASR